MSDRVLNAGFGFYKNFWEAIENLPLEQQKEVCYAVVKYGITNELVDVKEFPLGHTLVLAWKTSLDNSIDRWEQNKQKASVKRSIVVDRENAIGECVDRGLSLKEIAQEIGMSESTVKRSEAWRNRKQNRFPPEVKNSSNDLKNLTCQEESTVQKNSSKQVKNDPEVKNEQVMNGSKMTCKFDF